MKIKCIPHLFVKVCGITVCILMVRNVRVFFWLNSSERYSDSAEKKVMIYETFIIIIIVVGILARNIDYFFLFRLRILFSRIYPYG